MNALQRPLTYDDLLDMPDDGQRREVIGGELIVNPAPTPGHQRVARRLFRLIDDYAMRTGAGEAFFAPVDVLLGRFDTVQPDLVFLSSNQPRVSDSVRGIEVAPDLVVEVLSLGTAGMDRVRKMALYANAGVREYWLADPAERTLVVHFLVDGVYVSAGEDEDGQIASRVLPGLRIEPGEVFADLV
jgi:Uma2 family endonuclease